VRSRETSWASAIDCGACPSLIEQQTHEGLMNRDLRSAQLDAAHRKGQCVGW
jgi:hypothetical protein